MKPYRKELLLLTLQLALFYVYPCFAASAGPMGMVFLILLGTLLLSVLMGALSQTGLKYLYPPVASVLFIPSVFIFYNESALVHALWYLVVSAAGLLTGAAVNRLLRK